MILRVRRNFFEITTFPNTTCLPLRTLLEKVEVGSAGLGAGARVRRRWIGKEEERVGKKVDPYPLI